MHRLAVFGHTLVQFSPSCRPDSAVHYLAVQHMHKFVTRRRTASVISKTSRADNPMPPRKPLEYFFKGLRLNVGHRGSNRHRQGKLLEEAHDLERSLLLGAQPLNPEFNHLSQGLRRLHVDLLQGHAEMPAPI